VLVRVLGANPVTSTAVFACITTIDTCALRRLHPAIAGTVAGVPWGTHRTDTPPVVDVVRWRAALPCAVGAKLLDRDIMALLPVPAVRELAKGLLTDAPKLAALAGVTHLDLRMCTFFPSGALFLRLPPSLRALNVAGCTMLSCCASFAHLTALVVLNCSGTSAIYHNTEGLPPSLQELDISSTQQGNQVSLAHLVQLRVLCAGWRALHSIMLEPLPPSLVELHAAPCNGVTLASSFPDTSDFYPDGRSLALLPPSLVFLNLRGRKQLTPAASLPPLPALRLLDVSGTLIGDALLASLPGGLQELRVAHCRGVTASATLDHVPGLRELHCIGTDLAPAVLAACRARGCAVSAAASRLREHRGAVTSLVVLADGRLASCDKGREVRLWNTAAGAGDATVVLQAGGSVIHCVNALAVLSAGRLAVGVGYDGTGGCIEMWDVAAVPPVRRDSHIRFGIRVTALLGLRDGRLAVGDRYYREVHIADTGTGAIAATLEGHGCSVEVLAELPDGTLASGSWDCTVRLWNVDTRTCVATLAGHSDGIRALAVLPDGRLASGADDGTVRLWDVGTRTCVNTMTGHTGAVTALAALPDGRLATGGEDGTIRLWDTRAAAAAAIAASSRAAGTVPADVCYRSADRVGALLLLPDGHLALGAYDGSVYLLDVPPPVAYVE